MKKTILILSVLLFTPILSAEEVSEPLNCSANREDAEAMIVSYELALKRLRDAEIVYGGAKTRATIAGCKEGEGGWACSNASNSDVLNSTVDRNTAWATVENEQKVYANTQKEVEAQKLELVAVYCDNNPKKRENCSAEFLEKFKNATPTLRSLDVNMGSELNSRETLEKKGCRLNRGFRGKVKVVCPGLDENSFEMVHARGEALAINYLQAARKKMQKEVNVIFSGFATFCDADSSRSSRQRRSRFGSGAR